MLDNQTRTTFETEFNKIVLYHVYKFEFLQNHCMALESVHNIMPSHNTSLARYQKPPSATVNNSREQRNSC